MANGSEIAFLVVYNEGLPGALSKILPIDELHEQSPVHIILGKQF